MNYNEKVGKIVEDMKYVDYWLDCIISNYFGLSLPKLNHNESRIVFFSNVFLHGEIISMGSKIKVIKIICNHEKIEFNPQNLHRLVRLRNMLAHESSYVENPVDKPNLTIAEITTNYNYVIHSFDDKYREFLDLYAPQINELQKLNEALVKKCQIS